MNPSGWKLISAAANVLAPLYRAADVAARLPMRLLRLAALRARASGRIPATTQFDGHVATAGRVRLSLDDYCRLGRNTYFETGDQGRIELGAHVWLNAGCVLVSYAAIRIGDHTLVGEYASIRDANHGIAPGTLIQHQPHEARPISIGRDVWIGRGAAILAGVQIGDGAVVGANAVVTRDVPAGAIAAGVPARVIRMRNEAGVSTS